MNGRDTVTLAHGAGDAEVVALRPVWLVGLRDTVALHALRTYPAHIIPVVAAVIRRMGVHPSGPPMSVFRPCDDGTFEVTAGFPAAGAAAAGRPFVSAELPGGRAVQTEHRGPWSSLLWTYDRLSEWLTAHHVTAVPLMWEEYLVGPEDTADPAEWRTRVVVPLRAEATGRFGVLADPERNSAPGRLPPEASPAVPGGDRSCPAELRGER